MSERQQGLGFNLPSEGTEAEWDVKGDDQGQRDFGRLSLEAKEEVRNVIRVFLAAEGSFPGVQELWGHYQVPAGEWFLSLKVDWTARKAWLLSVIPDNASIEP
jgi:hypothetical protein